MPTNATINPQYVGSSVRDTTLNPETSKGYRLTPEELVKVALGAKFKLGSGNEVNGTYDTWTTNLYYLMRAGHISQKMKDGFIALNLYNRSSSESSDSDNDKTDSIHHGCYWPPYTA